MKSIGIGIAAWECGALRAQVNAPKLSFDRGHVRSDFRDFAVRRSFLMTLLPPELFPARSETSKRFSHARWSLRPALPLETPRRRLRNPQRIPLMAAAMNYRWHLGIGRPGCAFNLGPPPPIPPPPPKKTPTKKKLMPAPSASNTSWFPLRTTGRIEGVHYRCLCPHDFLPTKHVKIATYGGGPKIAWRQSSGNPCCTECLGGPRTASSRGTKPQLLLQSRPAVGGLSREPRISFPAWRATTSPRLF